MKNNEKRENYLHVSKPRITREIRVCKCGCQERFEVKINSKKQFVSGHNAKLNPPNKKKWITKVCPMCDKSFKVSSCNNRIKCCSILCAGKYKSLHYSGVNNPLYGIAKSEEHKNKISATLKKIMSTPQAKKENSIRVKKAMQFKEVREKIRRGMKKDFIKKGCIGFFKDKKRPELSKENHWNWKNGKTPLAFAIRHLLEYKQWIEKSFKRDNYTCQVCYKRGGDLEVHHKKEFSKILDEFLQHFSTIKDKETLIRLSATYAPFWDLNNGKTLCKKCHNETKNNVKK